MTSLNSFFNILPNCCLHLDPDILVGQFPFSSMYFGILSPPLNKTCPYHVGKIAR
jgi:hypothetical protein